MKIFLKIRYYKCNRYYNRIDISEGIDPVKSNINHKLKFQDHVCNDLLCLNISDIAIITVKNVDYHCIMYDINKSESIHLLENSVLEDREYLLNLSLFETFFKKLFFKMVDIMKSLNNNIGPVMKVPEMLELVPDHLKTKNV